MKNEMLRQLTPEESALILLDLQAQPLYSVQSHDRETIINHVTALVEVAKVFRLPTIVSTLDANNFGGPLFQELEAVLPEIEPIDRTRINAFEDKAFQSAVKKTGRRKLILAGLPTETSVTMTALSALREEYEVFIVTDACGGANRNIHERALDRLVQAGAVPTTWQQVTYELQADLARMDTAEPVRSIIRHHCGSFATGAFLPQAAYATQKGVSQQKPRVS